MIPLIRAAHPNKVPVFTGFENANDTREPKKAQRYQFNHLVIVPLLLAFIPSLAFAQAVRFDFPVYTTSGQVPSGAAAPVFAVPNAAVIICQDSACASRATTYTSATAGTSCGSSAQLTPPAGGPCTQFSDAQGNAGFWVTPGSYYYRVTFPGNSGAVYGPVPISLGASAGCPAGVTCDANYASLALACAAAGSGTLYGTRAWNAVPAQTLSCPILVTGNFRIQPASGQTVTLARPVIAPPMQIFDYSAGGTVVFTAPAPTVYPEWWGGGTGNVTPDTAAENAALAAFNCGTIVHSPITNTYTVGTLNPMVCGTFEGNQAAIQAATNGILMTLNYNSPGPTGVARAPRVTNVAFRAAPTFTPTDFIKINTADDALIDGNTFSNITATHSIIWVGDGFGASIRKNIFNEGTTAPRVVYLNSAGGADNATTIAENDFTQPNAICIEMTGGGLLRTTIIDNIIEGCTLGGVQLTTGNAYGFYYRNYNEANTNFDLNFAAGAGFVTGVVDSSLFNNAAGIIFNTSTNLTVTGSLFDGACVDTNAGSLSASALYRSIQNRQADIPAGCITFGEMTANAKARIPSHFEFTGSNDSYDPPTTSIFNVPACGATTKGYRALVKDGDPTAGWGGITGAGAAMVWTECNGTNYVNVGK